MVRARQLWNCSGKYGVRIKGGGEKCGTMQKETRVEMSEVNAMKGRDGKS